MNPTISRVNNQNDLPTTESETNEAPGAATPRMRRRRVQQLSNEIGRLVSNLVGCVVIGWACFNIVKNTSALRAADIERTQFLLALVPIVILGVIPFGIGVWLLTRTGGTKSRSPASS